MNEEVFVLPVLDRLEQGALVRPQLHLQPPRSLALIGSDELM